MPAATSTANITVNHDNQNYGPFSIDQINQMLAAGRLNDTDLAWIEGTPDWQRVSALPGILRMPPLPNRPLGARDLPRAADESDRQILPAFLFAFFLGVFGVHRFYTGKTGSGVAMVLLTLTVFGAIISIIWATIDWVLIVCGAFEDAEGKKLRRWT